MFNDLKMTLKCYFYINWFTHFFTKNLGTEGKIKIKKKIHNIHLTFF